MFEHDDDEFGFWRDEPTRPLERIQARLHHPHSAGDDTAPTTRLPLVRRPVTVGPPGSRRHGHPQPVAVVESVVEPVVEPLAEPVSHRARPSSVPVDPLLRRIGALAVALALCVPVALSLRTDDAVSVRAAESPSSLAAGDGATSLPAASATAAQAAVQPVAQAPVAGSQAGQAAGGHTAVVRSASATAATAAPTAQASVAPASAAPPVAQPKAVDAASTSCSKRYTVVAGDYWILIAKKVSVSLSEVLAANNAGTNSMLYPGRSVCLPANASSPTTVPAPTSPPTTAKPAPSAPPTTKPPATTAPTTVPPVPPKATYTPAEVTQIIREVWPDDQETEAIRIATRESHLDPMAKNYCCYGLFQIYFNVHKSWLATIGVTNATQLFDPRVNAYAALVLYLRSGGWGPWKL